jgi:hypothetical protein
MTRAFGWFTKVALSGAISKIKLASKPVEFTKDMNLKYTFL